MPITIWHNPRCSKSRATLALLEEKGIKPVVRLYLDDSPSAEEIKLVLKSLDMRPQELMRKGEQAYKDNNLKTETDEEALISAMANNPILIERPIVIHGNKAAIGRPPENVLSVV